MLGIQAYDAIHGANKIGLPAIYHFGSEELKNRVIPEVLKGEKRICLAISEAYGASDVANLKTTA
jgi:alkylation response protein AidB-like acyl-CoA dehydrogenase